MRSKVQANMAAGATPTCIVDHWVLHMMESKRYEERIAAGETNVEKPTNLIRDFTNEEIGETLFTFLFASQDASSSATTWLFQILAQRPDVLDRLREENLNARNGDKTKSCDLAMLESLTYTNAVIKELLRHRPPGSMIIPSYYPALHDPEAYPEPDVFNPDRWITGDAESKTKNWLVFGAAALELDWTHHATDKSEEIRVFATLFPMDGAQLVFKRAIINSQNLQM
ncbi:Cytochrome P450 61 [Penicillium malachiteum]|uniref:Cytochrome P450 61 n=1 Tax=Penicillium malachiteum TaxID=1324776 RepID=A0AAD6MV53_9EURO|nr:Cytochrome P450 61 [Penicillium malachiteum]